MPKYSPIYIVKSAMQKLANAYEEITSQDDEYAVPAYTIAESSIFIDCEPLSELNQTRSRFNVLAHAVGVQEQLERMQQRYDGKVRLSTTHCHQFGNHAYLSSTDLDGFRRILRNPNTSKPYADGSRIPVILVADSGRRRRFIGFYVTPRNVIETEFIVIPDESPLVTEAWNRAPVAIPELFGSEIHGHVQQQLGTDWTVHIGRSRQSGEFSLLLSHKEGTRAAVDVGKNFPFGKPSSTDERVVHALSSSINYGSLMAECMDCSDTVGFSVHVVPHALPTITTESGESRDPDICFLNHIDWTGFGPVLLEAIEAEIPVIELNPVTVQPEQTSC